jgi:hypothetical protein
MTDSGIFNPKSEIRNPQLFQRPLLQSFVVCRATDPFPRFLIEEKRDSAAIPLVIFLHPFRIGFVMPYFKFRYVHVLFFL